MFLETYSRSRSRNYSYQFCTTRIDGSGPSVPTTSGRRNLRPSTETSKSAWFIPLRGARCEIASAGEDVGRFTPGSHRGDRGPKSFCRMTHICQIKSQLLHLNHPNIFTFQEIAEANGHTFIAIH